MRQFVARSPVALFVACSLGMQLSLAMIVHAIPVAAKALRYGAAGPLFFALAITWYLDGSMGLRKFLRPLMNWCVPAKWYMIALSWKFVCVLAGIALLAISGFSSAAGSSVPATMIPLLENMPVVACTAVAEVIAWMLFTLNRSQDRYTALGACLLIAMCRAAWYLPLMITGDGMPDGLPWWILLVSLFSSTVILAWLYNMTQSGPVLVIAQIVAHVALAMLTLFHGWPTGLAVATACASASLLLAGALILWYGPGHLCDGHRARWSDAVMRIA